MWIEIKPLDVLFFRDAYPFSAGEAHRARTQFPPLPTTIQGAIRTATLAPQLASLGASFADYNATDSNGNETADASELEQLRSELGDATTYGQLRLRGPFLVASAGETPATLWFPTPLDVLVENGTGKQIVLQPAPDAFPGTQWNAPKPASSGFPTPLVAVGERPQEPKFRYVHLEQLNNYLQRKDLGAISKKEQREQQEELNFTEQRFGIQIDRKTGTVAPHMLYTAEVIRLKAGDTLLLKVECPHFPSQGLLWLGGEGRAVRYESIEPAEDSRLESFHSLIDGPIRDDLRQQVEKTGRFKLYLVKPAIFRNGWLPDFIDPNTLELNPDAYPALQGVQFRLVSASVGKPFPVGGWDLAAHVPKSMFKAVPAGSTYYFELMAGEADAIFDAFHFQPLVSNASEGSELRKLGFGLTLIGRWDYV